MDIRVVWSLVFLCLSLEAKESSFQDACKYCHKNEIALYKSQSKENWQRFTGKETEALKEIHTKAFNKFFNYIDSSSYDGDGMYQTIKRFAPDIQPLKSTYTDKRIYASSYVSADKVCLECHDPFLSKHYTKSGWKELLSSPDALEKLHLGQPKIIEFIHSEYYKQNLGQLVKKMQFLAPESKNYMYKKGFLTFKYEHYIFDKRADEALFEYLYSLLEKYELLDDLSMELKLASSKSSMYDMAFATMTLSMSPVETNYIWKMEAVYKKKRYSATTSSIGKSQFVLKREGEPMHDIVNRLVRDLIGQMNLSLKK